MRCMPAMALTCAAVMLGALSLLAPTQVVAVPGRYFSARAEDKGYKCKYVRMAFSSLSNEQLQDAAQRFAKVLDACAARKN
jgi:DNA-binding transcriptional MocR family regulator